MSEAPLTFLGHLEELRRSLLKSLGAVLGGTALCLGFSPQIYRLLQAPLKSVLPEGSRFIVTTPFESYAVYFKISLVFGFLLSTPFIFYFIWSFIRPGLNPAEKRGVVPVSLLCALLFVGGALFGYFAVFPAGFRFAVEILKDTGILFMPKMDDYLSFALRLLLAFGVVFELPLLLLLLGKFGLVDAPRLRKFRKYAIVLIFLAAAILTPGPDVLSQVLMAIPLLFLYELGILLVALFGKKPQLSQPLHNVP
jgi:Twin arginine targeting (Tat) protein translocase TatC